MARPSAPRITATGCHAAANGDAFGQSVFHLVPGGLHLVDVKDGGQRDFRALAD
jgi:hypothetical protein